MTVLENLRRDFPEAGLFFDAIESGGEPFDMAANGTAMDLMPQREVQGRPNRAVLKVFRVDDGPMKGRAAVFFYKRSQIPFSNDRHSYGVCLVPAAGLSETEAREWLDFAVRGFHPASRPERLRLAFSFTIPD